MQQGYRSTSSRTILIPIWVRGVALILGLYATLLVVKSSIARISHASYNPYDDVWLEGLPSSSLAPGLDVDARYRLLFPAAPSFDAATPATANAAPAGAHPSRGIASAGDDFSPGNAHRAGHEQARHPLHSRAVLLPDLHGDADQATRALLLAGLISPNTTAAAAAPAATAAAAAAAAGTAGGESSARRSSWGMDWRWTGGDAVLVQLGDVVDRGHDSLALLGLLERLRVQALAAGGDVVALLGNHELMNIHHDFRYVSRLELLELAAGGGLTPLRPGAPLAPHGAAAANSGSSSSNGGVGGGAGGAAGEAVVESTRVHSRERAVRSADDGRKDEEQEEERSLRAETGGLAAGAADRELRRGRRRRRRALTHTLRAAGSEAVDRSQHLSDCEDPAGEGGDQTQRLNAIGSSSSGSSSSGSGSSQRRLLAAAQPNQRQQQQLMAGMDVWRRALAAEEPLGSLIRQRPLAALVDAGGCRILVVHAGAFPWMLRGVERVLGAGDQGAGGGDPNPDSDPARPLLRPEQYIAAWNSAVAAALRGCEGRGCGRRGADGGGQQGSQGDAYDTARLALAELLLGGDGAVWSRRYDSGPAQQVCSEVAALVRQLGVQRVVVGHTVQPGGRVSRRCGGQLIMADVGLSRAIAGEMAVLECTAGNLNVLYGTGRVERLK